MNVILLAPLILLTVFLLVASPNAKERLFATLSAGSFRRGMWILASNHQLPHRSGRWILTPDTLFLAEANGKATTRTQRRRAGDLKTGARRSPYAGFERNHA